MKVKVMVKDFLKPIKSKLRSVLSGKKNTFGSYQRPLINLCKRFNYKKVLEFGPGGSTMIILRNSEATVLSFETDRKWYDRYTQEFSSERVKLEYREPGWRLSELDDLNERFDLIFIDAGDRVETLLKSSSWLQENGMVYLHDAHRDEYETGIKSFQYYHFIERHSCLLCNNYSVYKQLKNSLPFDDSCTCQYCFSSERQAYITRMVKAEVSI